VAVGSSLPWGGQRDWGNQEEMMTSHAEMRTHAGAPRRRLEDAQVVSFAGGSGWPSTRRGTRWTTCACTTRSRVVLSGDHVCHHHAAHLRGRRRRRSAGLFFDSLDRMTKLEDVKIVLPAHGHPFNDLTGRVDAISCTTTSAAGWGRRRPRSAARRRYGS
jgi:hypothetical protein